MFNQTVFIKQNQQITLQSFKPLCADCFNLRVKPYYMFQCGSFRGKRSLPNQCSKFSVDTKGIVGPFFPAWALPNLSLDIPGGGGKVGIVPEFTIQKGKRKWLFKGWDGLKSAYINPPAERV